MKSTFLLTLSFLVSNLHSQIITTYAGTGYCCGNPIEGGTATSCSTYYPNGVACDAAGNLYISEPNRIRKVTPSGLIYTVAGSTGGYSGDGGPATSAKLESSAIAIDAQGNIFAGDWYMKLIRKINVNGIISTITGTTGGFSGDGGPAINAGVGDPEGLAVDAAGNLYISDFDNKRIRKINSSGIISTIGGNGSSTFSGDGGPATSAGMSPTGIAVDAAGNLFFADENNNRIRKINTAGIITTIAGDGTSGFGGDGGPATSAQLKDPYGVAVDPSGNLYFSDMFNQRIRMVNSAGIITTVAGTGLGGYSGDGGPAILAQFTQPMGICLNSTGSLFIADKEAQVIRKIDNVTGIEEQSNSSHQVTVIADQNSGKIVIKTRDRNNKKLSLLNVEGKLVFEGELNEDVEIPCEKLSDGIYIIKILSDNLLYTHKIIVLK